MGVRFSRIKPLVADRCRMYRKPNGSFIKWLYLFTRYCGVAFQMFVAFLVPPPVQDVQFTVCSSGNQVLSKHVATNVPIALHVCRVWYTWRIIASQVMLASVEAILIIRGEHSAASSIIFIRLISFVVYALYNRSKKVAGALIFLVFCEMTLCVANSSVNIPRMSFSPECHTVLPLRPVIQFGSVPPPS